MKKLLIVLLALLCMDCHELSNFYLITVDGNFNSSFKAAAHDGAVMWEVALDGELDIMDIRYGQCQRVEREICIFASSLSWIRAQDHGADSTTQGVDIDTYTTTHSTVPFGSPGDSAEIYIPVDSDTNVSQDKLTKIMAHEIGHGMGLQHIQGKNIMYWWLDYQSDTPTCSDTAQWLSIRHEDMHSSKCPQGGSYTLYHNP